MQGATARVYDYYYARPPLQKAQAAQAAQAPAAKPKAPAAPTVKAPPKVNHGRRIVVKTAALMFMLALLLVFLCIRSAVLNYQILALERENSQLETERLRLEYQISQQQSLDRIALLAATELNMVKPGLEKSYVVAWAEAPILMMENDSAGAVAEVEERQGLSKLYESIVSLAAGNG